MQSAALVTHRYLEAAENVVNVDGVTTCVYSVFVISEAALKRFHMRSDSSGIFHKKN